jgi:glutamyl-Q tRNA(Asp) synthetase
MSSDAVVTRFAPSPTGFLHLGHAYAAIFAENQAKQAGGRFILRIEDIDKGRCKAEFEEAIYEDLEWLGLQWEQPVRRQSENIASYAEALEQLDKLGLIYPCFCTRGQIKAEIDRAGGAPHGLEGPIYPGTCRQLNKDECAGRIDNGETPALRLDMAKAHKISGALSWQDKIHGDRAAKLDEFGDIVLARKDIPTSYHLSVTVDDALQGVTLVTRGEDLADASGIHRLLQALLGYTPPIYHHHPILTDDNGKRFAKRDQSVTLRALRATGKTPQDIRTMVGLID